MQGSIPRQMKAAAIDRFGGPEVLHTETLPVPKRMGARVLAVASGSDGVEPEPRAPKGVAVHAYDGLPGRDAFDRLNQLIAAGPFHVELGRVYPLDEAARAHREIDQHHLGKLALRLH